MNTEMFEMVNHNHSRKASRKPRRTRITAKDIGLALVPYLLLMLMQLVEWIL